MPNFALRNGHCKSRMSLLWSIRLLVILFSRELGLEFEWLSRNLVKSVSQSNVNTSWTKCFKKCQGYVCTCHPFTVQQNLMLMMIVPTADADVLRINAVFVFSVGWGELALLISSPACSSLSSFFTCSWGRATSRWTWTCRRLSVVCEEVQLAVVQKNNNQLTTLPGTQTQFVFLFVLLVLPDVTKEVSVGVTCDR